MGEAVSYNSFPLTQGTDESLNLAITDAAGAAVDLTGATVTFVLATPNDGTTELTLTTTSSPQGITITDASGGLVSVPLVDSDTDSLLGDYQYEVKITESDGSESITNRGIITFERAIT